MQSDKSKSMEKRLKVTIYSSRSMDHCILPKQKEAYWLFRTIQNSKEPLVQLRWKKDHWHICENERFHFCGSVNALKPKGMYMLKSAQEQLLLYVEEDDPANRCAGCYSLEGHQDIAVGRDASCEVQIKNPYVSKEHFHLYFEAGTGWKFKDADSRNGVYINQIRCFQKKLENGDVLHIPGADMVYVQGCIFLKRSMSDQGSSLRLKRMETEEREGFLIFPHTVYVRKKAQPSTSVSPVVIEGLPSFTEREQYPLWYVLGPSATMGIASLCSAFFLLLQSSQQQMTWYQLAPSFVMAFSMAAGTLVWPLFTRAYEKKQSLRKKQEFLLRTQSYLQKKKAELEEKRKELAEEKRRQWESFADIADYIETESAWLWNRRIEDISFLKLYLGICQKQLSLPLEYRKTDASIEKEEWQQELEELLSEKHLEYLPEICPLLHRHIGIYGKGAERYLSMLLLQLAALHSAKELSLCVFYEGDPQPCRSMKWLPHFMGANTDERFFYDEERDCLKQIQSWKGEGNTRRAYVFVLLHCTKKKALRIKESAYSLPLFSILQTAPVKEELLRCDAYIACQEELVYEEGKRQIDLKESVWELEKAKHLFAKLSLLREGGEELEERRDSFGLLDLYACGNVEQLNIEERWRKAASEKSLAARIGLDEHGELLALDIHEKAHGPHGLIAGTTGSGKSECILTYLLSLAVSYSFMDVSFVLIDYKGGMMAEVLHKLPHVAALMTNLDKAHMQRMQLSLKSELQRRQKLFAALTRTEGETMDIYRYQRLQHEGSVKEPLSHLLIVADEFAELKQQEPEFLDFLKQIARIGRSLGVHLLLATQKPSGVVDDQIWSNSRFHLCLKVQDKADSLDMLKREDAALLCRAGEFCFQVGNDEMFLLGRSAWTQRPYHPHSFYKPLKEQSVVLMKENGERLVKRKKCADSDKKELDAVVAWIIHCAKGRSARRLAHPLLRDDLSRAKLNGIEKEDALVLGMVDDVKAQRQYPWKLALKELSHLLYAERNDGSCFLQVLLKENERLFTERKEHLYVYIAGKRTMKEYLSLSTVQEVIETEDISGCTRLFAYLSYCLSQRKKQKGQQDLLLVVVQEYEVFKERCSSLEDELVKLLREGEEQWIFVLLMLSDAQQLSFRLLPYFHTIIAGRLHEDIQYHTLLTSGDDLRPLPQKNSFVYQKDGSLLLCQGFCCHEAVFETKGYPKRYPLPVIPAAMSRKKLRKEGLFLGWEIQSCQELALSYERFPLVCIIYQRHLPQDFQNVIEKQLAFASFTEYEERSESGRYLWKEKGIVELAAMTEAEQEKVLFQGKGCHVFFIPFSLWQESVQQDVLADALYEAVLIWVGRGLSDASYVLKKSVVQPQELKRSQAAVFLPERTVLLQIVQCMSEECI